MKHILLIISILFSSLFFTNIETTNAANTCSPGYKNDVDGYCVNEQLCPAGYNRYIFGCKDKRGNSHDEWASSSSIARITSCPQGEHMNKSNHCVKNYSGWEKYYPDTWKEKVGGDSNNSEEYAVAITDSRMFEGHGGAPALENNNTSAKGGFDESLFEGHGGAPALANTCPNNFKEDVDGYCVNTEICPKGYSRYIFGCRNEQGNSHKEWASSSSIARITSCPQGEHMNKSNHCIKDYEGWKQYYPKTWKSKVGGSNNNSEEYAEAITDSRMFEGHGGAPALENKCNSGFKPDANGYCVNSQLCPAGYNRYVFGCKNKSGKTHKEWASSSSIARITSCPQGEHMNKSNHCIKDYEGWKQYYPNGWENRKGGKSPEDSDSEFAVGDAVIENTCYCPKNSDSLGDTKECYGETGLGGSIGAPKKAICKGDSNYNPKKQKSFDNFQEKLKGCKCPAGAWLQSDFKCHSTAGVLDINACEEEKKETKKNSSSKMICKPGLKHDSDGYCVNSQLCPEGYSTYLFGCENKKGHSHTEWGSSSSIANITSCPDGEHLNKAGHCVKNYKGWKQYYPNKYPEAIVQPKNYNPQTAILESCYCKNANAKLSANGNCTTTDSVEEAVCKGSSEFDASQKSTYDEQHDIESIIKKYDYNFLNPDGSINKEYNLAEGNEKDLREKVSKEYDVVDKGFTTLRVTVTLGDGTTVRTIYPEEIEGLSSLAEAKAKIKTRVEKDGYTYNENGSEIQAGETLALRVFDANKDLQKIDKLVEITDTTKKYSGKTCREYVAGWEPSWTQCEITSRWFTDKALCKQTKTYYEVSKPCGEWEYNGKCEDVLDKDGKVKLDEKGKKIQKCEDKCHEDNCPANVPFDKEKHKEVTEKVFAHITYNDVTSCNHTQFADLKNSCEITFHIYGGRGGLSNAAGLEANRFTYNGAAFNQASGNLGISGNGLLFAENTSGAKVSKNDTIKVNIKSIVPFSETSSVMFDLESPAGGKQSVKVDGIYLSFKKPIDTQAAMTIGSDGEKPQLGKLQSYNVSIGLVEGASAEHMSNFKLTIKPEHVKVSEGFKVLQVKANSDGIKVEKSDIQGKKEIKNVFSVLIDAKKDQTGKILSNDLEVYLEGAELSYNIGGERVTYQIKGGMGTAIQTNEKQTLGLQVSGIGQTSGRGDITGQDKNRTELQLPILRSDIRKSAYTLIRSRETSKGKVVKNIYYNTGDTEYSSIPENLDDGGTIIIKNGNLIIDENINKKVGIILISDNNYNFKVGSADGNIYINNNVTKINAAIYADGSMISADKDGKTYTDKQLAENKLEIKGSVFTKNTVGGAVAGADGFYILPDGKTTQGMYQGTSDETKRMLLQFKLASKYDLNYLRKVDLSKNDFSVKIEPDSSFTNNPPAGFGN